MHINSNTHNKIGLTAKDAPRGTADEIPVINADQSIKTALRYYDEDRLQSAAEDFEASHPSLSMAVDRIIHALGQLGI